MTPQLDDLRKSLSLSEPQSSQLEMGIMAKRSSEFNIYIF